MQRFLVCFFAAALLAAPAAAAPDRTQGVAVMSGIVSFIGTLSDASGIISAQILTTGNYKLEFARPLAGCTRVAGPGQAAIGPGPASVGIVSTRVQSGSTLIVEIHDDDGFAANRDFHIIVFCPK
jgi:hypothetical protein